MRGARWLKRGLATLVLGALLVGLAFEYRTLKREAPDYSAYKNSLYRGLRDNDFAYAFVAPEDRAVLRTRFAELEEHRTKRQRVVAVIHWLDTHMKHDEVMSVRAVDLLEAGSAACEVHALAIGILDAFDVQARWISNVKTSLGFGYLEAYVEDGWELFRIRSGREDPGLGVSAWTMYRSTEPSLSIRNFWFKPGQSTQGWKDSVYPGLFPFANVQDHPELETIFTTADGLDIDYVDVNPFAYVYGYFQKADGVWVENESLMNHFRVHLSRWRMKRARWRATAMDRLGLSRAEHTL